jgi:hypothetical protein
MKKLNLNITMAKRFCFGLLYFSFFSLPEIVPLLSFASAKERSKPARTPA